MTVALQFALIGLGAGALYGLSALGLVLVYRGSGVINFAHGALGLVGAYLFYELHDVRHWPFAAAFPPALIACGLLGVLIQLGIMRPLRSSSALVRLLATLAVLTTIQGLISLSLTQQVLIVAPSLPGSPVQIGGVAIGEDQLALLAIAVVLTAGLAVVYKRTKFGLATSAVAENARLAGHLGYSPNTIAAANWAIGSMLAGTAGVLLAPITGLDVMSMTLMVIPALAAAVVGRMVSFPVTLAAGLLMGVLQSELTRYVSQPGWATAVPFFVIIVVLAARGTSLPTRGESSTKLPAVGSGRIRPCLLAPALAGGAAVIEAVPLSWVDGITETCVVAIVVLSVVVVTGYAGQLSLAQWALAGVGAWIAAQLVAAQHFPFWLALLVALLAMVPVGVLVGLPALRTRGDQLAILTLGVGVAVSALIFSSPNLTGGSTGIDVGFPTLFGLPIDTIFHPRNYALVSLGFFVLAAVLVVNLRRGRAGRRLLAIRSNERAAASLGVAVAGGKLYSFALSGVIAALGGIFFAFSNSLVTFDQFSPFTSVTMVVYAVVGGLGYATGPLFGAVLQPGALGTNIGDIFSDEVQKFLPMIGGVLLIVILITNVDGLTATEVRRWSKLVTRVARPRVRAVSSGYSATGWPPRSSALARVRPMTLEASGLTVCFGRNQVLTDVSFSVRPGEVLGLIGPNGAGKTTVLDAVTGYVDPVAGTVRLNGVDLLRRPTHRRAQAGLARSHQSLELFDDMTVLENLLVADQACAWWRYATDLVRPGRFEVTEVTRAAIETFGLADVLSERPGNLPYGMRRLIAIARSVAAKPSVLLLDEPAAGLSATERVELRELIHYLAKQQGLAVLLIEHDVDLVLGVSDRVVVLEFGIVIASGPPGELRADPRVIAAYLGESGADDELLGPGSAGEKQVTTDEGVR
jgi:sulfate-transporting ATPase